MKPFFNRVVTLLISVFLLNGCMLFRLHEDLEQQERFSYVSGIVKSDSPHGKAIQVLAIRGDAQNFSSKAVEMEHVIKSSLPLIRNIKFWEKKITGNLILFNMAVSFE